VKVTKRQLRRIIREYGRSEHDAEARGMVASYQRGYSDGYEAPHLQATTGRDPEYLRGYEDGAADAKDGRAGKYIKEARRKVLKEGSLQGAEERFTEALSEYVMILDEELGYDIPHDQLKAEVMNLVDGHFEFLEHHRQNPEMYQ